MSVKLPTVSLVIVFLFSFLSVHAESTQTEFSQRDWLEKWEKQNKSWRVMHLGDNVYDDIDAFKEYINHVLVPMKYNVIVYRWVMHSISNLIRSFLSAK
jgi:hypothetical protein